MLDDPVGDGPVPVVSDMPIAEGERRVDDIRLEHADVGRPDRLGCLLNDGVETARDVIDLPRRGRSDGDDIGVGKGCPQRGERLPHGRTHTLGVADEGAEVVLPTRDHDDVRRRGDDLGDHLDVGRAVLPAASPPAVGRHEPRAAEPQVHLHPPEIVGGECSTGARAIPPHRPGCRNRP